MLYCTYCSAEKSRTPGAVPAMQRYRSARIEAVHAAAVRDGVELRILSGRYGLLRPTDPIEYYDHLLTAAEVDANAELVARQLREQGIGEVLYVSAPLTDDTRLTPYYDAIRTACRLSGVEFDLIEIGPRTFTVAPLHANLQR